MQKLSWTDLQFVLAVADYGSLSAAGRALGVNHATVQRRIENFEQRQDVILFERTPRGYRPTVEAGPLFAVIRSMATMADGLERSLAGHGEALGGKLHLTTTDSLAESVLPRQLERFRQVFPDVDIEVTVTNSRLDLARLDADLSIRPALQLDDDLTGTRVGELVFRAYGLPRLLDGVSDPRDAAWIGIGEALKRSPVGRWEREALSESAIRLRMSSFVAMAHAAAAGNGLAMLPDCAAESFPELARVAAIRDRLSVPVWVATHRDLAQTPRIQAFLDHFIASLAEDPVLGGGKSAP